jgi:hypothetical protein
VICFLLFPADLRLKGNKNSIPLLSGYGKYGTVGKTYRIEGDGCGSGCIRLSDIVGILQKRQYRAADDAG